MTARVGRPSYLTLAAFEIEGNRGPAQEPSFDALWRSIVDPPSRISRVLLSRSSRVAGRSWFQSLTAGAPIVAGQFSSLGPLAALGADVLTEIQTLAWGADLMVFFETSHADVAEEVRALLPRVSSTSPLEELRNLTDEDRSAMTDAFRELPEGCWWLAFFDEGTRVLLIE